MRRVFQDGEGNEVGEIDLWKYGYDARKRSWYWQTMRSDGPDAFTAPYLSFSIGAPVITVSAPLRGKVPGVIAADLKLDTFSDFVQAQRPGEHGTVMIFDQAGRADRASGVCGIRRNCDDESFAVATAQHRRDQCRDGGLRPAGSRTTVDHNEGIVRDDEGQGYLFRLTKFAHRRRLTTGASILLLAAEDDFVQNVRRLQLTGLVLAIVVGAAFVPVVWMFGSTMSQALKRIAAQARQLQTLAEPKLAPVTSISARFTSSAIPSIWRSGR